MFKVILLPVDIGQTEAAKTAIAAASQLMQSDTKLVLLNVVDEVPAYIATQIPKSVSDQVNEDAKAALDKLVSGHELPGTTETLVRDGHPSRTILEVGEEIGADVIVIASHDPGLADYLLGSTAGRVVRHAHCSVLVVRNAKV